MRTTLDIDDDILAMAKEIARAEKKTAGQVISDLARKALTAPAAVTGGFSEEQAMLGDGIAAFPQDKLTGWMTLPRQPGPPVTLEHIRRVQDEIDGEDAIPWDFETNRPRVFDGDKRS